MYMYDSYFQTCDTLLMSNGHVCLLFVNLTCFAYIILMYDYNIFEKYDYYSIIFYSCGNCSPMVFSGEV